jgi:hypothetical protein
VCGLGLRVVNQHEAEIQAEKSKDSFGTLVTLDVSEKREGNRALIHVAVWLQNGWDAHTHVLHF